MKGFGYLRDPLFLVCLLIYFINRLIIKRYLPNTFSQSYLNDAICIPFWVPIMLFLMQKAGLRQKDCPPKSYEILIPLLIWSCAFESVAPYTHAFRGLAFGDPADILCYAAGALAAAVIWKSWYSKGRLLKSEAVLLDKSKSTPT